jgi:tRNA(Arg) A34 adenosine deaminase TadA
MQLTITPPDWLAALAPDDLVLPTDLDRARFVIGLAVENVERRTGGPFGAAVVESATGRLVAAGVNSVLRLRNPVLHAEVMAVMAACARVGAYKLGPPFELVSSCEPCAMCLGATLWSGVRRLVYAATRDDAAALGFEEGPVFPESYAYLAARGVEVVPGVGRVEAATPFERYRELGGLIYNG